MIHLENTPSEHLITPVIHVGKSEVKFVSYLLLNPLHSEY